ncbi:MAG: thiamine biosynthesis protein ApbE [Sphingobacteriales bacterium 50-39]|nr:FAD:protein FMN transferase [Sphingobacteriales bacterium]OJW54435.1 MAG: thiamine biosynthesis protein ApbE [Sphingobacteriales bacterium 50-39]
MIRQQLHTRLMGSTFELLVVEKEESTGNQRLQEGVTEIRRIEALLTEFDPASQTSLLNQHAGLSPVKVDPEVYQLLQRCLHLSHLTQGAFDITAVALRSLYNFKERQACYPDAGRLADALAAVGHRHIRLAAGSVFLSKKGMRIGFGAIGKGYAADKVRALWRSQQVSAGVINASGDLTAWGLQPDGTPWRVGIADPRDPSGILLWLPVRDAAVATSGNYEQYVEINGVRYSHNIDPRTGVPVRGVKSATVISPSAELSDALATAITVMGVSAGLYLIDQLPDVHGIIIDDKDRIFSSKNIDRYACN